MLFRPVFLTGVFLAGGVVLAAPTAFAQAPTCAARDADLPAELAAWPAKAALTAAASRAGLAKAALAPGQAYAAVLSPTPEVTYVLQPERPAGAASNGGLFSLKIETSGAYIVALGGGAWIDVLKDGVALRSVAHGHGPDCSTVRKMVTFDLAPGDYVVQISGGAQASLPILVSLRP